MVIDEPTVIAKIDDDNFEHVAPEPVYKPSIRIQGSKVEIYLEQHLFTESPFGKLDLAVK